MYSWDELLCAETLKERISEPKFNVMYHLDEFEKDNEEILTSKMFRFLQDKAQLFPLVNGRPLRTRLTHSIEVSEIGRQMGKMLTSNKKSSEFLNLDGRADYYANVFSSILSAAGLLHDVGNPPYGHFGEASIGYWFDKAFKNPDFKYKDIPVGKILNGRMKNDFIHYDGNCQILHVLFKNVLDTNIENINVTMATINTLIKYPQDSLKIDPVSEDVRRHKFGYFLADEETYKKVRNKVGLSGISRYPLTHLLEAADDIGYAISDLEDSINAGAIGYFEFLNYFENSINKLPAPSNENEEMGLIITTEILRRLKNNLEEASENDEDELNFAMKSWLLYAKKCFIYMAVNSFFANYESIMDGKYQSELLKSSWHGSALGIIKKAVKDLVLPKSDILSVELSGNRIISGLMDLFVPSVIHWSIDDNKYKPGPVENRFISYLPDRNKKEYMLSRTGDEAYDLYLRFHIVTDYLSTLTDTVAKDTYHILHGM